MRVMRNPYSPPSSQPPRPAPPSLLLELLSIPIVARLLVASVVGATEWFVVRANRSHRQSSSDSGVATTVLYVANSSHRPSSFFHVLCNLYIFSTGFPSGFVSM